ncbi:MAG: zinc-binding dehydrogenase [Pseudonocardiales bacterium]|nr:zinc-binding dehydrogenase [Pseudonocardiales bacterium]
MRVITYDPGAAFGLRTDERDAPRPGAGQALVQVGAASLNFGEVAYISRQKPGYVPGWDAAGTVVEAAADGSGPPADARVVAFGPGGAWAQQRAVDTAELAAIPDGVDFATAAALPVVGVTALRAVRTLGSLLGRTVLVTGASGGVGRIAVQLAAKAGARVLAGAGSPERGEGLTRIGADALVTGSGLDGLDEPVDAVIDNVGGPMLAAALGHLAPGALVLAIGSASRQPTTIDYEDVRVQAGGARIEAFSVFAAGAGWGAELTYLLQLIEAGTLDVQVGWLGDWERVHEAAAALMERRVTGKAVLEVS